MKLLFLIIFALPAFSLAARLEDIKILSVKPGDANIELKLQVKDGSQNSYFYLDIMKSDPESFDKVVLILKKLMEKKNFQLDLDIPSFSVSPSGAYYRSEGVTFIGPTEREPSSSKKSKNK